MKLPHPIVALLGALLFLRPAAHSEIVYYRGSSTWRNWEINGFRVTAQQVFFVFDPESRQVAVFTYYPPLRLYEFDVRIFQQLYTTVLPSLTDRRYVVFSLAERGYYEAGMQRLFELLTFRGRVDHRLQEGRWPRILTGFQESVAENSQGFSLFSDAASPRIGASLNIPHDDGSLNRWTFALRRVAETVFEPVSANTNLFRRAVENVHYYLSIRTEEGAGPPLPWVWGEPGEMIPATEPAK